MKHVSAFGAMTLMAALAASPVLAQPAPAPRPAVPAATTTAPMPSAATLSTTGWMTQAAAGEWRASKLKGLNVYNPANEKIGEIEELLVDHSGKITAAVIGVGGFLGAGEHQVAVPFSQLQFVDRAHTAAGAPVPVPAPAVTAATTLIQPYPDRVVLNMTKDQLKAAPQFRFAR